MPHGTQWSYDELRNAEREAQIYADAIARAQRAEFERQEQYRKSYSQPAKPTAAPSQPQVVYRTEWKYIDQPSPVVLRYKIEQLKKAPYGSVAYLQARYGKMFENRVQALMDAMSISREEAEQYLSLTYKPVNWLIAENRWIQEAMRKEGIC